MNRVNPFLASARRSASVLLLTGAMLAGCAGHLRHMDGWYHLEAGRYTQGLQALKEATEADPLNVRFRADWLQKRDEVTNKLLNRAEAAVNAQKRSEAREIYQTILAYQPDNERALAGIDRVERLGNVGEQLKQAEQAMKQGDRSKAQQLLNTVLDLAPNLLEAKALKRELEEREARDMLSSPSLSNLYRKPVTLEFRDASLKMVFEVLSRTTGINFILDKEIRSDQRTTIFLKQSSLEDAVDMLVTTNQLEKKVLNGSSVLIYPNTQAKTKEYQDLLVRAFYLHGSTVKDTANLIKTILKLKDVFVDEKLNMLVVRDTPEAIALTEKLIGLYDHEEPEVMLDVEVLEIARSRLLDLGVAPTDQFSVAPLGSLVNTGTGDKPESRSLNSLLHLNRDNLGITVPSVEVKAHQQNSDANLLANPRIRVRNRDKAKIHIGDKIPVVTTTAGSNGYVTENIQYLDVGLKLDVEPTVYAHDDVAIKIGLEVSSVVTKVQTKSGGLAYQIGSRSADTVLSLKDGETQILAGLIRSEERSSAAGLPGLTSMPILGRLFSANSDSRDKTEIVLSITPHLVRGIQRKPAGQEMFWSGTDAVLRAKPLLLRTQDAAPAQPAGRSPAANAATPASPGADAPKADAPQAGAGKPISISWSGPSKAKPGEEVKLALAMNSSAPMRGLPLQLAYDPQMLEIVAVEDGGYFSRDGRKGNFSSTVDKPSGRVSIALGSASDAQSGSGNLLMIRVKPLKPGISQLDVAGAIPIGLPAGVERPAMPVRLELHAE